MADQRFETTGPLLACLLGENVEGLNPKRIVFAELPAAKEGKGGLIDGKSGKESRVVDPWGHPYIVWIDGNYDNRVPNPDAQNSNVQIAAGAPRELHLGVIAFSIGEDGIEGTKDDLMSWRDTPMDRNGIANSPFWRLIKIPFGFGLLGLTLVGFVQGLQLLNDGIRDQ